MKTSPIDSVIIDLILDHYNIQSLRGHKQILSGADFDKLVADAKEEYYKRVLRDEETTDINTAMKEYEELHFDKLGHCEWEVIYEYKGDRI